MDGAVAVKLESMKIAEVNPKHIRGVSWAPSPVEPAMPEFVPVAASPAPPVMSPAFEPLVSAPLPDPLPLARAPVESFDSLRLAIEVLRSQGERLAEQARSDALELGILIARRILEREITTNLDGLFSLIKSAIRKAGEAHVTRIRLHPADVERVKDAAHSEFSLGKIELVADASLTPGDVMVDTAHHAIDGRLSTRFEELVRQLDGATP